MDAVVPRHNECVLQTLQEQIVQNGEAYATRQGREQLMRLISGGSYGLVLNGDDMWRVAFDR